MKGPTVVIAHLMSSTGAIRVVIPKQIREEMGLSGGDYLQIKFDKKTKQVYFKKVPLNAQTINMTRYRHSNMEKWKKK